ncbi:MAG: M14 family zinc carboxypeptidase, partial [Planctomycetota bacterium]|nr:M14 family zinc carboxypeptidase [Planctomycetota bacterium]
MRRDAFVLISIVCLLAGAAASAGPLPENHRYDPEVPRPEATFGFDAGEWHLRPEQSEAYFRTLAETSRKVRLELQGRTWEGRRQWLAVIASEEHHADLDRILAMRAGLRDAPELLSDRDIESLPAVVWLGFSIHGDEASGSNAAPWVAYHLAASQESEVAAWLSNVIVLIDPSLNPDGMARFATWANMHRGRRANGDPWHREHRQGWTSGRTNHYWFDLNRDWLLAQHP